MAWASPPNIASAPGAVRIPPLGPWSRRVMLGVLGFFLMVASGRVGNRDVAITLDLSRSLLEGNVSVPASWTGVPRRQEGATSHYGIGHSLSLIPYILAGRVAAAVFPMASRSEWEEFFVSFSNVPVVMLILYYLSRRWRLLGCGDGKVGAGLLIVAMVTQVGPYAKLPFSDGLLALGILAAWCHWMETGWRSSLYAGFWLGFACVSRRQADIVIPFLLPLVVGQAAVQRRWTDLRILVLSCLPAVAVRLAYNHARFGTVFSDRQPGIGVDRVLDKASQLPVFFNLGKVLMSTDHGFLVYGLIPVVVSMLGVFTLGCRSRWDAFAAVWIPLTGILILSELSFGPGVSFGSRYLLFAMPFLLLAWPGVRIPQGWVPRLACGLVLAGSAGLMATGFALDPLPIATRMKKSTPPVGYVTACRLEWKRVLGLSPGTESPGLNSDSGWNHHAFARPDFWWCHAIARLKSPQSGM
ncbi:MAG: hypothetical protein ACO3I0_04490 [Limisphaerales bacterium]